MMRCAMRGAGSLHCTGTVVRARRLASMQRTARAGSAHAHPQVPQKMRAQRLKILTMIWPSMLSSLLLNNQILILCLFWRNLKIRFCQGQGATGAGGRRTGRGWGEGGSMSQQRRVHGRGAMRGAAADQPCCPQPCIEAVGPRAVLQPCAAEPPPRRRRALPAGPGACEREHELPRPGACTAPRPGTTLRPPRSNLLSPPPVVSASLRPLGALPRAPPAADPRASRGATKQRRPAGSRAGGAG